MKAKGKSAKEYRLNLVVQLHKDGHTQVQIASLTGLSQSRVSAILKVYREKGESGLVIKSPPGRQAGLGSEQLDLLKGILNNQALSSGFPTQGWTLARIRLVIKKHFGLTYSLEHVRRLMKKIGFTRQRPHAQDYRQDPQAVKLWQNQTLPSLKKSEKGKV